MTTNQAKKEFRAIIEKDTKTISIATKFIKILIALENFHLEEQETQKLEGYLETMIAKDKNTQWKLSSKYYHFANFLRKEMQVKFKGDTSIVMFVPYPLLIGVLCMVLFEMNGKYLGLFPGVGFLIGLMFNKQKLVHKRELDLNNIKIR